MPRVNIRVIWTVYEHSHQQGDQLPMRHLLLRDVAISLIAQSHDKYTNYPPITQLFSQFLAQKIQKRSNLEKEVINKLSTAFAQPIPMKKLTILTILTSLIAPPLASQEKNLSLFYFNNFIYLYII